ncbi:unnamed protein product [Ceratitis capitata]|uniref:(Mediterranean fruit fly) hypothetical protein n=1 Tax=Ceratitis capitata TaxID=7213 RepID=A0A811V8Z1_CERCA|nr:unnamed protein product [Ceratitis capitata]
MARFSEMIASNKCFVAFLHHKIIQEAPAVLNWLRTKTNNNNNNIKITTTTTTTRYSSVSGEEQGNISFRLTTIIPYYPVCLICIPLFVLFACQTMNWHKLEIKAVSEPLFRSIYLKKKLFID